MQILKDMAVNLGCYGNLCVDALTRHNDFKIFPHKFCGKSVILKVKAWTVLKLFNFKTRDLKIPTPGLNRVEKNNNNNTVTPCIKIIYTTAWFFNVYSGYDENILGREG